MIKYHINYNTDGKILCFAKQDTNLNVEVTNTQYVEAQKNNKINVNGDVITFETVDWRTQEEIQRDKAREGVNYIKKIVQDKIDKYNLDHGTVFTNIDGRGKYARRTSYTHYQFAVDILNWNEDLWEESEKISKQILAGTIPEPTLEEFAVMLPPYTGVE